MPMALKPRPLLPHNPARTPRPTIRLLLISSRLLNPVHDITAHLDIVVGKLTDLGVVDAHDLVLLAAAEVQAGDQINEEEDDAGADEGVGEAAYGVGELVRELDPVPVQPAAGDHGVAVEVGLVEIDLVRVQKGEEERGTDYVVCGEEAGK